MNRPMRRQKCEVTDPVKIEQIIKKAGVVHLGMVDEGKAYIVPLHYGYIYKDGGLTLYMHGATEGRKYDVIAADPNVFIEIDTDMVLTSGGEVPCEYGANYACVMGEGTASILTDVDEKVMGLELIIKSQLGRDFIITEPMTKLVNVIKVVVPELSVKMNQEK